MLWITALIIGVAVVAWFFTFRERGQRAAAGPVRQKARAFVPPPEQLRRLRESGKYSGVQIIRCGCAASSRLSGTKFPIDDVPALPVRGCQASRCTCYYVGLDERRSLLERRERPLGMGENRRSGDERRRDAKDVWESFGDG